MSGAPERPAVQGLAPPTTDDRGYFERIGDASRGSVIDDRSPRDWAKEVGQAIYYGDPQRKMDGVKGLLEVYHGAFDQMGKDVADFAGHPATSVLNGVKGLAQLAYDTSTPALLFDSEARARDRQVIDAVPAYLHGLQQSAAADDPYAFGQRVAPVSEAVASTGLGGLTADAARGALNAVRDLTAAPRAPVRFATLEGFLAQANDPARNAGYEFNGHTYFTDHLARTRLVEGLFRNSPMGRNDLGLQRRIGYSGYGTDVGFHLVPDSGGAPTSLLSVVPGNGRRLADGLPNLNTGPYAGWERKLRSLAADPDKRVFFQVEPQYDPGNLTRRPDRIVVRHRVNDGGFETTTFTNKY